MMNRSATQSLRGMPAGFGGQQQPQRQGRVVSNQLPNGKTAGNASGWAFGGNNVPLSGGGIPSASRPLGGTASFAQTLGGSQPATPLDINEFPSLSNNPQHGNAGQANLWATATRNVAAPIPRNQGAQQQQQQVDDLFGGSSRLSSAQGSFRFGGPPNAVQGSQSQAAPAEEFPPLARNANGDIGQERGTSMMSSNFGFSAQTAASAPAAQTNRQGNGLLNALSANSRTTETISPMPNSQPREGRSSVPGDDDTRQKNGTFREDSVASQSSLPGHGPPTDNRNPLGAIGNDSSNGKGKEALDDSVPDVQDPLAGISPADRFGLKGLRHMMATHSDFQAYMAGVEPAALGFDINSEDMITSSIWSPLSTAPPRPAIPKFRLPECYQVNNVQPIDNKIGSFNEETLMWIFYSCPGDIKQQMAAMELNNRNWRWHKKEQIWLTKDEQSMPNVQGPGNESGAYIIWDARLWRKERRGMTLWYSDLDGTAAS